MIIDNIIFSGFKEFVTELLGIDNYYYEKGLSNKDKGLDGRVRLGNNQESILDQIVITFVLSDVTLLDIDTISSFASEVALLPQDTSSEIDGVNIQYKKNPFSSVINLSVVPDVLRYTDEASSIFHEIKKRNQSLAIQLSPIGCFKFKAVAYFRGLTILSLFNGFIENFIYTHFDSIEDADILNVSGAEVYKNFVSIYTKRFYQESTKSSLIEDFMIYDKYFSYITKDYENNPTVSLAKVIHPVGEINFFGDITPDKLQSQISMFRSGLDDKTVSEKNTNIYFVCSSDFFTFLTIKNCAENLRVTAFEKFDILYSDTSYRFPLNAHDRSTYEVRINMMLHHNKEARNIVLNDKSDKDFVSKTNLSDPSLRYGMILSGQQIKYLLKVNLSDIPKVSSIKDNTPKLMIGDQYELNIIFDKIKKLSDVFKKASGID